MFSIFSGKNFIDKMIEAAQKKDAETVVKLLKDNFDKIGFEGENANKVAQIICLNNLPLYNFLIEYCRHNPNRLTDAQFVVANFLSNTEKFDEASMEARHHLNKILEFSEKNGEKIIKSFADQAAYCHLTMSGVFTTCGARSYSKQLIKKALEIQSINAKTVLSLNNELANLDRELQNNENIVLDEKWNALFSKGANALELIEHCRKQNSPILAQRVDLIHSHFRFNIDYKLPENEYLQEVFLIKSKDNDQETYVLR